MRQNISYDFDARQSVIVDMLLVGADPKTIRSRLRMTADEYAAQLEAIKKTIGVRSRQDLVVRLRAMRSDPTYLLRKLRDNPRQWWQC